MGRSLYVGGGLAALPTLTIVRENLFVGRDGAGLPALTHIEGNAHIGADDVQLPSLRSIAGNLDVYAARARLDVLKSVGGTLNFANIHLPALRSGNPVAVKLGGVVGLDPTIRTQAAQLLISGG